MERVSSQWTIFLRIALPTSWVTSVLSLVIVLGLAGRGKAGLFGNPIIWISLVLILGSGMAIIKFLLWRFYRIDMDGEHVYVSNYFKTYKYPYQAVESIQGSKIFPGRIFRITFKSKGSFGKKIYFLASQVLWIDFLKKHQDALSEIFLREPHSKN
jgi:hypothetical protein